MYYLELSEQEMEMLRGVVEYRRREMQDELAHTEGREFHEALKADLERLEKIENRIGSLFDASEGSIAV